MEPIKNRSNVSIALVICYFGKFPWYFDFFIKSCTYNPSVDFIIATDNKIFHQLPDNVKCVPMSLSEFKQLASEKLGFKVGLNTAYKLNDFKPAYGLIFSDLLKSYQFWGYGDIDVIYGTFRNFITDEVLKNFDVIAIKEYYTSGFFTLLRNIVSINKLFENSKDYKLVYKDTKCYCFDECNHIHDLLTSGIPIGNIQSEVESMTHVVKKLEAQGNLRAYFDLHAIEDTPGRMKWDKGRLIYKNKYEALLYHLIAFKKHPLLRVPSWDSIPDTFYIHSHSFSKDRSTKIKDSSVSYNE